MTPAQHSTYPSARRLMASLLLFLAAPCAPFVSTVSAQSVTASARQDFDIPAGDAIVTLKQAAQQGKVEIMFPADVVAGVKTAAVKGKFSPKVVLDRMLKGTGLVAVVDEASGALAVRKDSDPNDSRATANPSDRPNRLTATDDGTLELDKFEVVGRKVEGWNNKTLFDSSETAPLAYDVVTRGDLDRLGITSMQELFRIMPQATNYGYGPQNGPLSNVASSSGATVQADSVGLRGFANSNTIVLINGRRVTGAQGEGADPRGPAFGGDIGKIPTSMIDHIEILPASAGAIYGGGAIGGVVNVILRKDFNERRISTYVGTSTGGGGTEVKVDAFEGFTFNEGRTSLTVSLGYENRGALYAGQRDYLQRMLEKYGPENTTVVDAQGRTGFLAYVLPLYAGNPGTVVSYFGTPLGIPGDPTATFATLPAGLTHEQYLALTPADFNATAGQFNLENGLFDDTLLYAPNETWTFQGQLDHEFLPDGRLEFFSEFYLSSYRTEYNTTQNLASASAAPGSALNPFSSAYILYYYNPTDLPPSHYKGTRDIARVVAGLKGKWGDSWSWASNVYGEYTLSTVNSTVPGNQLSLLTSSLPAGLTLFPGGTPITMNQNERLANIYSPFVDHDQHPVSQDIIDDYFFYQRIARDIVKVATWETRVNGEVFQLPAGPAQLSSLFEIKSTDEPGYQRQPYGEGLYEVLGVPRSYADVAATEASAVEKSAAVEVVLPVIGRDFHPVPVHALEFNASKRWESINHGLAANPTTLAGRLAITPWLAFRASETEGFARLRSSELVESTVTTNVTVRGVVDPLRGGTARTIVVPTQLTGGNPDLRPQYARSTNFGVMLTPENTPFRLNVDYWKIDSPDAINSVNIQQLLNTPDDYPADRLQRAALTAEDQALGYTGGAIEFVNLTNVNVTRVLTDGWDAKLQWTLPTPEDFGHFTLMGTATRTLSYEVQALPSSESIDRVGISSGNTPLKWKGYAGLYWSKDRWEVNVTATYYDKYLTSTTAPSVLYPTANGIDGDYIPSSVLLDLQLVYKVPARARESWRDWAANSKFTLGVRNLFDKEPPMVTDGTGFYSRYYDPRQRYVYLQIDKTF